MDARMQIMAALIGRAADPHRGEDGNKCLLQFIEVTYRWETRPAPEVIAELKAAVASHPQDVVNQLRLARSQYVLGRRGRARECYRRALQIEPESLEAGLGLAQIMADAGEQHRTFDKLCELLEGKSRWRFFRTDELPPKRLAEDFVQLFNKLHAQLGVRDRAVLLASTMEGAAKVGRNDPCPCGSGKKYKKCCLDAGAVIVPAISGQGRPWSSPSVLRRNAS
jgi:tetratricopeptide (TPR) repeat protein